MVKSVNKRIGILGGTFNPVHNGHLYIAKNALKKLRLDKIIFVPTYVPPHKKTYGNIRPIDRLRMLRLALAGKKRFEISLYEMKRKGKSYSIRTARFLKKRYGKNAELFFLIGADSFAGLKKWKDIKELSNILKFAAFPRRGYKIKAHFKNISTIDIPKKDISSTKIRHFVKKGKSIKRFVPKEVEKYIRQEGLYRK